MSNISFDGNVSVSVSFAADVDRFDAFGIVVMAVAYNSSNPDLMPDGTGGVDRYRVYNSASAITADETANELTALIASQARLAFAQDRPPRSIIIGQYDPGSGAEDPSDLIEALDLAGQPFYGFALINSADFSESDIPLAAASLAARRGEPVPKNALLAATVEGANALAGDVTTIAGADYDDADWLTLLYHDGTTTGQALSFAHLVARLGFSPDKGTAGFEGVVRGVEDYVDLALIEAGRANMEAANIQLYGTYGGAPYVSPGKALSGRPLVEQVSVDWFQVRFAEDLRQLKLRRDAAGQQIPLDREGQEIIQSAFARRIERGEALGKFVVGQSTLVLPDPIPASDIAAERFSNDEGKLVLSRGGRIFDLDFTASA